MPRLAIALCLLLAAPGCGAPDEETQNRPLKVRHANGQVYVPGKAKRVVALTADALDTSLALGVKPVGAATAADGSFPSYLGDRTRGIEKVGPSHELDLAAIKRLKPDVILGTRPRHGSLYREMREVGATVNSYRGGRDWLLNTRLYGEALGRTDEAERLMKGWDRSVARTRRALRGAEGTRVSVVRAVPGEVWVAGDRSFAAPILDQVRLARTKLGRARRKHTPLPAAQTARADAPVVLLARSPPRARAPALRERVVGVPNDVWWSDGGILAARAALGDLERALGGSGE